MEGLIMILGTGTLATWLVTRLLGPFASALARRIEPRRSPAETDGANALHDEIEALYERIDFLERAMASIKGQTDSSGQLPKLDAPEHEHRVITPV